MEGPQAEAEGQRRPDEDIQGGGEKNGEKLHGMMKVIGDLHHDDAEGQHPQGSEEEGEIENEVEDCQERFSQPIIDHLAAS